MATISDLKEWFTKFKYATWENDVFVVNEALGEIRVQIFSNENCYTIDAYEPSEKRPEGYLGCGSSSRKPRAGETWTRGSDLADGPFDIDTWLRILSDIVSYEIVKVHKHVSLVGAQAEIGMLNDVPAQSGTDSNAAA